MAKTQKSAAPAVEKKTKMQKASDKPKPVKKSTVSKVLKAEKKVGGISEKFTGVKEKKPKAAGVKPEAPPVSYTI